jgi:hypothetical protein
MSADLRVITRTPTETSMPPAQSGPMDHRTKLADWLVQQRAPQPKRVTRTEYRKWSPSKREAYDGQRRAHHLDPPLIAHDAFDTAFATASSHLDDLLRGSRNNRQGIFIYGEGQTGKSTLLTALMAAHFRRSLDNPVETAEGADHVPIIYSTASAGLTAKQITEAALQFLDNYSNARDSLPKLERRLFPLIQSIGTTMFVIDEAQRVAQSDMAAGAVGNMLRNIQNNSRACILLAGIHTNMPGVFQANNRFTELEADQMRERFEFVPLHTYEDPDTRDGFYTFLSRLSMEIFLLDEGQRQDSSLAEHADDLWTATRGRIGAVTRRVTTAANRAIADGQERFTPDNLGLN